jgi:hypothetical protein
MGSHGLGLAQSTFEDDPNSPKLGVPRTPHREMPLSTEPSESVAMYEEEEEGEEGEKEQLKKKRIVTMLLMLKR